MTLWIVVALRCCFLRISLFSSVAYFFFSCCWCFESFVSSENLLFRLVLLFHFLPAPISGSVMLLIISFKEMLLLLSSCCSSRAAYRFCRSILNSFTICLHTLSGSVLNEIVFFFLALNRFGPYSESFYGHCRHSLCLELRSF